MPGAHVRRHAQGDGGGRDDRRRDLASGRRGVAWSQSNQTL